MGEGLADNAEEGYSPAWILDELLVQYPLANACRRWIQGASESN